MTDDSFNRTSRVIDLLASSLDATDETPDLAPRMTLVDAAYHAVQYACGEAQDAPDPRTTLDLSAAQDCFMRIMKQEGGGGPYDIEGLAAYSLERSLSALRRSLEIKAGLCQQMTAGQMNRRAAGVDDPTRLGDPDQSRRKAWVAALRAQLPWTLPEDTWAHGACMRMVNDTYNLTLDWLKVPDEIQRRVDARRERDRQMVDHAPGANVTLHRQMEDDGLGANVTIH